MPGAVILDERIRRVVRVGQRPADRLHALEQLGDCQVAVLDQQLGRRSGGQGMRLLHEGVGGNLVHRDVGGLMSEAIHDFHCKRASRHAFAQTAHKVHGQTGGQRKGPDEPAGPQFTSSDPLPQIAVPTMSYCATRGNSVRGARAVATTNWIPRASMA